MKRVLKPEMKLGAEPKKLIMLGVLVVIGVVVWFVNRTDTPPPSPLPAASPAARPTAVPSPVSTVRPPVRPVSRPTGGRGSAGRGLNVQEFHPVLKSREPIDTSRVDPTLRLDLLAKVRNVAIEGGSRSLFAFSGAPAPTAIAKVAPIKPNPLLSALTTGPSNPKPPPPEVKPAVTPPPTIPLKFYGYTNAQRASAGPRRAFFIEGEDIYVAGEGDTIKGRYKIIRIGVNSAVVEDTQFKNQQTLALVEEVVSS